MLPPDKGDRGGCVFTQTLSRRLPCQGEESGIFFPLTRGIEGVVFRSLLNSTEPQDDDEEDEEHSGGMPHVPVSINVLPLEIGGKFLVALDKKDEG